ncbi:MAG: ribbon-helix-helix protein, CopG family [Eubacteriales bacterium]|nr:ribbon-helix-helix protein, CopG family [Eubacteriales bacterium]
MASVNLTIRIDENDKKTVERLAKKDDRSINYIVNQAIKEYIKKNVPDKEE